MQIIAVALVIGLMTFLVVILYIVQVQNQGRGTTPPQGAPLISLIAAGFLGVLAIASFLVPAAIMRSTLQRIAAGTWKPAPGMEVPATDAGKLMVLYQTTLIVGLAMLEGPGFFGGIAYLLEAQAFALGIVAVGIILMLARFPTESRVRRWLEVQEEQLGRARQESSMGGRNR